MNNEKEHQPDEWENAFREKYQLKENDKMVTKTGIRKDWIDSQISFIRNLLIQREEELAKKIKGLKIGEKGKMTVNFADGTTHETYIDAVPSSSDWPKP